jgi:predicted nucleic acid-binding protein
VIAVDTNIIAYFIIPGDATDLAELVYSRDGSWAVPTLWRSEFRNLLALYIRQGIFSIEDAKENMSKAEDLLFRAEYGVESSRVLELASVSGCTAYDCEFVYVAEALGLPLVTSDKKLLRAFPSITVSMAEFIT